MATVTYPAVLPKPLINITRSQSPGFQLKQPIAGPGYVKQITSDSPATYELSWRMSREKALQFMAWFYGQSGLNRGFNRFTISLDTEFGPQDHTFQLTPDNLLPAAQEASNVFSYSATAICRKVPIPAVYTDNSDLIVLDAYNYRADIDIAMNQVWPESYPEPVVIPGTTSAFTSGLYYSNNNAVAFSDLVTFSRATTATYIDNDGALKTAAANEPRFEDSGLLIEPQSTNAVTISEGWAASSYASPAWAHSTPDAEGWITVTGGSLEGAPEGSYRDLASGSAIWSSTSTLSLDIRKDIPYAFVIRSYNSLNPDGFGSVTLIFSSGSALPSHASLKIVDMGTWLRITHTRTFGASGTAIFRLYPFGASVGSSGSLTYRRVQVEKLSHATSYIKTTGTAATRAADSASVLMQAHTAGTIFAEFISDAVAIERIVYTAGAITLKRLANGATSVTAGAVTVTSAVVPSGSVKSVISYDGSTLKLAVNGVVYSAASTLPSAGTILVLGASTFANVWQRSEAYDNSRLIEVTQ